MCGKFIVVNKWKGKGGCESGSRERERLTTLLL